MLRDLHEFRSRVRCGNIHSLFPHSFDVKLYRFVDELDDCAPRLGDSHAAGKVGHVCSGTFISFFDDDCIAHLEIQRLRGTEKVRQFCEQAGEPFIADSAQFSIQILWRDGAEICQPDKRGLPEPRTGKIGISSSDDFIKTIHFVAKLCA